MSISIKDVVAITGVPGLHQIIKADDKAIIVESIDELKKRQMVRGNMMASKIMDVSIYTLEDSEPLVNVLKNIKEKFDAELPVDKKSSKKELFKFLKEVLPNFDEERVYPSNIKKLVSWYKIIHKYEVILDVDEEGNEGEDTPPSSTDTPDKGVDVVSQEDTDTKTTSESDTQTKEKQKKALEETESKSASTGNKSESTSKEKKTKKQDSSKEKKTTDDKEADKKKQTSDKKPKTTTKEKKSTTTKVETEGTSTTKKKSPSTKKKSPNKKGTTSEDK